MLIRAERRGHRRLQLNRNLVYTKVSARARSEALRSRQAVVGAGQRVGRGQFDDGRCCSSRLRRSCPRTSPSSWSVRGLLASIVARIGVPQISGRLMEVIDAELGAVPSIGAIEDISMSAVPETAPRRVEYVRVCRAGRAASR